MEFLYFARKIQKENEDVGITMEITCVLDAEEYIHEYCENLRFVWSKN